VINSVKAIKRISFEDLVIHQLEKQKSGVNYADWDSCKEGQEAGANHNQNLKTVNPQMGWTKIN